MTEKKLIDSLYVILCLYEDMLNPEKSTTEKDYITYLKRKYTMFLGKDSQEIAFTLKGLIKIGPTIEHDELKTIVFHMISLVGKENKQC